MASPIRSNEQTGYRHTLGWNIGFSSYWFANSYKWFILLFVLIPSIVNNIVPGGEKNSWWGLVFGLGAFWAIIGPPIFGRLNETLGGVWRLRQPWILIGSAVTVIGLFAVMGSQSLWTLSAGYFMLQIGDDIGTGPYAGMVADTVPEEHRGYSSSVLGALRLFGQVFSALIAVIALAIHQTGLIFVGIALVNIGCALWTCWTIRNVPPQQDASTERGSLIHDWIEPFKSHDFKLVWFNRFVCSFAFSLIAAYTFNFLHDMFKAWTLFGLKLPDARTAALALAITISLSGIVGSIISARMADKHGRKPLLIASGIIIFFSLIPIAFTQRFDLVWVCVAIFGVGNGIYVSADWALIGDILPHKEKAATEMGVWHAAETIVQMFGVVTGFSIDFLNRAHFGLGYQVMVLTAGSLFLLSTFIIRGIKGAR